MSSAPIETRLFIDGRFVDAIAKGRIAVHNPADGSVLCEISEARAEDVDSAVAAAQRAFAAWSGLAASDRGRLLLKLADAIEARAEEFAQLEALDTGHPLRDCRILDVPRTVLCYRYFGGMADKLQGTLPAVDAGFLNYVKREPLGVVGQIVPWNFPLMFTSWKLGPALAAGNCVVMKPSELTPLTTLRIAQLAKEVGFPDGVINVVPGYGHSAGQRLAEHPQVAKIAFTGSTATGRKIVAASQGNLKRVQLELGGKGANIVFDDANLVAAVNGAAWAIFHNQGQACIAGSRLILQNKIADEFIDRFTKLAKSIRLGDPLSDQTEMGPLTSAQHRDRVLAYIKVARDQGSEVLTGGAPPRAEHLARGYYVEPTVVTAKPGDRVAQEEVFGPFVSITRFADDDEALAIANGTEYGLGSGLWTSHLQRAHRCADRLRAGMVWINCYKRVHPGSPFGGVGQSGYGREMGFEAMHEYTEAKSVWINVDAQLAPYYRR